MRWRVEQTSKQRIDRESYENNYQPRRYETKKKTENQSENTDGSCQNSEQREGFELEGEELIDRKVGRNVKLGVERFDKEKAIGIRFFNWDLI